MSKEAMKLALENSMPSFMSPEWTLVRNEDIAALREALAEPDFWEGYVPEPDKRQQALDKKAENARELGLDYEPAQQVVDSNEKAGAYMEARLWEFIDMAAAWPKASPDPRTWNHVMVYAPKPARQEPFGHVTVRRLSQRFENHADQYHFYPAGQSPYLDNVDELHAVYTRPQAREPLTDEQIDCLYRENNDTPGFNFSGFARRFARAIEAAHGIKENT